MPLPELDDDPAQLAGEQANDLGVGPHGVLAGLAAGRFAQQRAADLEAHGLGGLDAPEAVAGRARPGEGALERPLRALAGELDEAERPDGTGERAGAVARERLLQLLDQRLAVRLVLHVDEVHDDDPAEVAQAQLADHLAGGLQVDAEHGVLEVGAADVPPGVDVDGHERLGLVDHERAAGAQPHLGLKRLFELRLDPERLEDIELAAVQLDLVGELRLHPVEELHDALVPLGVVDPELGEVRPGQVPRRAEHEVEILVHHARRARLAGALADVAPHRLQHGEVGKEVGAVAPLARGAHDRPSRVRDLGDHRAQALALGLVGDPARHADVGVSRHQNQVSARDRDVRGGARALAGTELAGHLHEELLPLPEEVLDRWRGRGEFARLDLLVLERLRDVVDVEKSVALESDVHERRLHAGEHPRDAALVQAADDRALARALDHQLDEHAVLAHGDAGLVRCDVRVDDGAQGASGTRSVTRFCILRMRADDWHFMPGRPFACPRVRLLSFSRFPAWPPVQGPLSI